MVLLSDEKVKEFQKLFEKEYGKKLTMQEASESAHNLVNFVDVLLKIDAKDRERKYRLRTEPKGFHVYDGTYSCIVCHTSVTGPSSWYDQYGIKCLDCQRATEKGVLPPEVFGYRKKTWYAMWELQNEFGIHPSTARKMVRTGELKARIVEAENGAPYFYLFLIKENPILNKKEENHEVVEVKDDKVERVLKSFIYFSNKYYFKHSPYVGFCNLEGMIGLTFPQDEKNRELILIDPYLNASFSEAKILSTKKVDVYSKQKNKIFQNKNEYLIYVLLHEIGHCLFEEPIIENEKLKNPMKVEREVQPWNRKKYKLEFEFKGKKGTLSKEEYDYIQHHANIDIWALNQFKKHRKEIGEIVRGWDADLFEKKNPFGDYVVLLENFELVKIEKPDYIKKAIGKLKMHQG